MNKRQLLILYVLLFVFLGTAIQEEHVLVSAEAELPAQNRYIALTFDDGPRADTTARLLDGLKERGVNATFFLVGEQIERNPELVVRIKDEGHQIGNHTWSHTELQSLNIEKALEEVQRTDALIRQLAGEGEYWIRPPYGLLGKNQYSWFSVPLVHWSLDSEDWKLRNTQADVEAVLGAVQSGDIILMHDTVPASVDAALQLIDILVEQGYVFVTVEELMKLSGVETFAGQWIRSAQIN